MYWFKYKELAQQLHEDRVSGREQVKYYAAWCGIQYLFSTQTAHFLLSSEKLTGYDYLLDVTVLIFNLSAIAISYKINSTGDNKNFISRCVCLFFPIAIRCLLFSIPFQIVAFTYSVATGPSLEELDAMAANGIKYIELRTSEKIIFYTALIVPLFYMMGCIVKAMKIASSKVT